MTLENLVELNNKLVGLPGGVVTFLFCLAVGFAIKKSRRISNDWLPSAVMVAGLMFMLMAPTWSHDVPLRIWFGRNFCFGIIIGFAAWISHVSVFKKLAQKYGWFNGYDICPECGQPVDHAKKKEDQ